MIRYRAPRRGGFTLIELLVVIAILAILSALVAAGIGRIRLAQQTRNTEATLTKLQQALDGQRKAVIDQCKRDRLSGAPVPPPGQGGWPAVLFFCGNDKDAAEALWVYANLKREFPETFAEAMGDRCPNSDQLQGINKFTAQGPDTRRGIWLWFPTTPTPTDTPAVLILSPRATFAQFSPAGGGGPAESAALLYSILTEKGNKGVAFAADDATAGAQTTIGIPVSGGGTVNARVFTDAWGTPIWFNRLANFAEVQGQPFVSAGLVASPNRDPIDPLGKLLNMSFNQRTSIHIMVAPPGVPLPSTTPPPAGIIDGNNKMTTVYSAGPDKTPQVTSGNTASDDVIGYRLRRLGAPGG